MKKIHLISLLVIMFAVSMLSAEEYTDDSGLVWQTDLDDALAIAKENGKPILINFNRIRLVHLVYPVERRGLFERCLPGVCEGKPEHGVSRFPAQQEAKR